MMLSDGTRDVRTEFDLRNYMDYVRTADSLCRELSGRLMRFHAVLAALHVCMQAPVTHAALDRGLDAFRLRDLHADLLPDERLGAVRRVVSEPGFWRGAIERARNAHPEHPSWERALRTEQDDAEFIELLGSARDGLSAVLSGEFETLIAERAGLPTVGYDGHRANIGVMIEAAERSAGVRMIDGFGLRDGTEGDGAIGVARNLERERVVLRRTPRTAELHPVPMAVILGELAGSDGDGAAMTYYVSVRWPRRLLSQFTFPPDDEETLRAADAEPWCLLHLHFATDDLDLLLLVPLDSPADLEAIAASHPCHSSVSSAALERTGWSEWEEALRRHSRMTVLWDTSPFQRIESWVAWPVRRITYGTIRIDDREDRHSLFWARPEGAAGDLYLAPCTTALARTLSVHLERLAEGRALECIEEYMPEEERRAIWPVLHHLFIHEASFDFAARSD